MTSFLLRRLIYLVVLVVVSTSVAYLLAATQLNPRSRYEGRNPPPSGWPRGLKVRPSYLPAALNIPACRPVRIVTRMALASAPLWSGSTTSPRASCAGVESTAPRYPRGNSQKAF